MQISIDEHSGFCFGVTRAIKAAESELANGPLYCLGDIRAHGEPPSTYWLAPQRGIEIIDATCPVVKKLQDRIRACYEAHKNDEAQPPQIVIYGQPGHAEVIGLQGQTNNTAIVIESPAQIDRLDFTRPIYLFSQTTKSVEGFNALVEAIQLQISNCKFQVALEAHDTICRNVANRVAELQDFARANDIVLFVGGKKSSNARVLYNNCVEVNPNTFFVSSPDEVEKVFQSEGRSFSEAVLQRSGLSGEAGLKVGICGATSTPLWLMEKVRDKLLLIPSL